MPGRVSRLQHWIWLHSGLGSVVEGITGFLVRLVIDRLARSEVVVVQSDALRMTVSRHTQIAIVTIVGDYCACRMKQAAMETSRSFCYTVIYLEKN